MFDSMRSRSAKNPGDYNLVELADAVNEQIAKERIQPADPRAKATVSVRTIQFYLSKGLLPQPHRRGGQLRFTDDHVNAIIRVKRRQAEGLLLDEMTAEVGGVSGRPVAAVTRPIESHNFVWQQLSRDSLAPAQLFRVASTRRALMTSPQTDFSTGIRMRWHIAIGQTSDGIELSGSGVPPSDETIDRIREILQTTQRKTSED